MMSKLLVLFGLLISTASFALPEGTQIWTLSFVRGSLDAEKKWDYYFEFQPRFDLDNAKLSRFLVRPAVVYHLDSQQTLWAGFLDVFNSDVQTVELRPWQQYQRVDSPGNVKLLNRTRLEERFKIGESAIGLRLRHMIRGQIPICDTWWAVVFDELFLGFNQNKIQRQGFDQNRAFAGIRKDLQENFFVEAGYLNQLTTDRVNHVPFFTLGVTIK